MSEIKCPVNDRLQQIVDLKKEVIAERTKSAKYELILSAIMRMSHSGNFTQENVDRLIRLANLKITLH